MPLNEEQIIRLETVLAEAERALDRCQRRLFRTEEAMGLQTSFWLRAKEIVGDESDEWRVFDRLSRGPSQWWSGSETGYVNPEQCTRFAEIMDAIKKVLNEHEAEFLRSQKRPTSQRFISAGQVYQAKKTIFSIMRGAKTTLAVVDQYLDESIFEYLESLDTQIELKLLTAEKKPIFKTLIVPFAQKRGKVSARICEDCHDRFLIVDDKTIVHLGASINHAGEKAFMINGIDKAAEIKMILDQFADWWNRGQPLV